MVALVLYESIKSQSANTKRKTNKMLDTACDMTWELSEPERQESMDVSDSMSMSGLSKPIHESSFEVFEPVRVCACAAPPRRFYRTFWRSVARRLLERKKTGVMQSCTA